MKRAMFTREELIRARQALNEMMREGCLDVQIIPFKQGTLILSLKPNERVEETHGEPSAPETFLGALPEKKAITPKVQFPVGFMETQMPLSPLATALVYGEALKIPSVEEGKGKKELPQKTLGIPVGSLHPTWKPEELRKAQKKQRKSCLIVFLLLLLVVCIIYGTILAGVMLWGKSSPDESNKVNFTSAHSHEPDLCNLAEMKIQSGSEDVTEYTQDPLPGCAYKVGGKAFFAPQGDRTHVIVVISQRGSRESAYKAKADMDPNWKSWVRFDIVAGPRWITKHNQDEQTFILVLPRDQKWTIQQVRDAMKGYFSPFEDRVITII